MNAKTNPASDTSGVHLWLVLWKATAAVKAHALRNITELGMGLSDFAVLELLLNKGPSPVNAIGRRVLLTSGSCTAAVDRLEKKGLVVREWDEQDRRVCRVRLTPAGRGLISGAFRQHADAMEAATAALSQPERKSLLALLKKLGFGAAALSMSETASEPNAGKRPAKPSRP